MDAYCGKGITLCRDASGITGVLMKPFVVLFSVISIRWDVGQLNINQSYKTQIYGVRSSKRKL